MISFALAPILLVAVQANAMAPAQKAYSACLKAEITANAGKKAAVADFDKAIATSCAPQEAAFKAAVVGQQISMKASRKDAEQAAADWVSDLRTNATEIYKDTVGERPKN